MASIQKTKNGDFRIRVSAGFDGNGKRRFFSETYTPTSKTPKAIEKEVTHHAEVLEEKVSKGKISIDGGIKFSDLVEKWVTGWAVDNLTESQVDSYTRNLELYVIPFLGNLRLSKIKKSHCQQVIDDMKEKGLSVGTMKRAVCAMSSVLKYALRLEIINALPYDRDRQLIIPKDTKDNEIHCFSVEQSRTFLSALRLQYPVKYGQRKRSDSEGNTYSVTGYEVEKSIPLQWQAYFTLALMGGLRKGEMLALEWRDIDFEERSVSITKAIANTKKHGQIVKSTKTESGKRTVHVPLECIELLEAWRDEQIEMSSLSAWEGNKDIEKNPVFIQDTGKRMDLYTPTAKFKKVLNTYNRYIDSLIEEADTEAQKKALLEKKLPVIRLHDLRHCFATLLISEGVDIVTVSKVMGHASPSITTDVYSHLLAKKNKEVADVFTRLLCDDRKEVQLRA